MKKIYRIQSVLIKRNAYSFNEASNWILQHGFKIGRIDITTNLYRFRQREPKKNVKYRISKITHNISFVIEYI